MRSFTDFRDLAVLIGGHDPAQHPKSWYGAEYHAWLQQQYLGTGIEDFLARKRIVFVDSITDLTRQAMAYARQQPEAFSERTGKPDVRGAYGLLGREVIQALKHLQHARGKTVIFVGVLERSPTSLARRPGSRRWREQSRARTAGHRRPGGLHAALRPRRQG
ncbi:AAA family ATPase [Paracoccus marcusii]|uniref:AAA family ATPase n=1 Tax=Paracoccus marcusii TaxID=59779 RepID=UPI002ED502F2|nr:AAA family ATPase [Paracoccus marcusii]